MKAILMSIQSKHLCNILNGEKTVELRKRIPDDYKGWVYLHCTKAEPYLVYSDDNYGGYYVPSRWTFLGGYSKKSAYEIWGNENIVNGKVVCRFWWDETIKISGEDIDCYWYLLDDGAFGWTANYNDYKAYDKILEKSCLEAKEVFDYAKSKDIYALVIKQLEIFDTPMELGELYRFCDKKYNNACEECPFGELKQGIDYMFDGEEIPYTQIIQTCKLTKAPQSWCYCEVRE